MSETGLPDESGFIAAANGTLTGPIVVTALQPLVDPAQDATPTRSWVIWSGSQVQNVWLCANDFKGPLVLNKGDTLKGRSDWTKHGVMYTGYRRKG